jgi:pyridoxine 5-phosphate synthase
MRLGVNIDHVATVRQARRGAEPDPIHAATLAELGGADSIVCHLREDRRHIQDRDLMLLKEIVSTMLNLEMGLSPEIIEIALKLKPHRVTFVPERRQELTTEGGLAVTKEYPKIKSAFEMFEKAGIEVGLFVDPDPQQIEASHSMGIPILEIHTGVYANVWGSKETELELQRLRKAVECASSLGIAVAAGHGLNYKNVQPVARIEGIFELNIGHSIVSRAIFVGMEKAVREMKELIHRSR